MAFQTGTQVRPELGRADVSGFARAGMITGQALANLGAQVGGAIKEYKQDKEKKAQDKAYDEVLVGLAQDEESRLGASLRALGVTDKETAGIVRKSLGDKFEPTLNMLMQIEAEAQQFQPEVFTIGEGENAVRVLRTSRGQVQLLKGEGDTERKTSAIRNYEYFTEQGIMTPDEARKVFFGDEESAASALAQFLSGDEVGNRDNAQGDKKKKPDEVSTDTAVAEGEEIEAPKAPVLSARQRAVQEMQARERSERPTGPMAVAPGLTEEKQKRYEELLRKKQGL